MEVKKSLAVRYRPQTFDEVTEQTVTIDILKQQIKDASFNHCYLFSGTSGCGKTTCARIFAREINSEIIEIDAASHTGVEDVRSIIENARRKSLTAKYKAFIVDECHAFSKNAWQAMLKLLEDTPQGCVIILCTTDPQKIPLTILNRVQRLEFTDVSMVGIVNRLQEIAEAEEITADKEGLYYIAGLAKGSMRTAVSFLEKATEIDKVVNGSNVVQRLGVIAYDEYFKLLKALDIGDDKTAIYMLEEQRNNGKDIRVLFENFTKFVLDCMKIKICQEWGVSSIPYKQEYVQSLRDEDKEDIVQTLVLCKNIMAQHKTDSKDPLMVAELRIILKER